MKKPSLQFYPGDWRKDPSVNCLSLAARGLWFEMLILMHESPRRGYLALNAQQLARSVGASLAETRLRLKELENAQTYSVDGEGMIFNRRMVRDEEISEVRSRAGKSGAENRWQNDSKPDSKNKTLPHPYEGEVEVETEVEKLKEPEVEEIFAELSALYISAGLPIPPKHKQLCIQLILSIPEGKRTWVARYVRHMLKSGRWSSAAKTKSLKNLLIDGDWEVPIIERAVGASSPDSRRQNAAERDKQAFEKSYEEWLQSNPGKTRDDYVDWSLEQASRMTA